MVGSNLNYNGKYCELGLIVVYNVFNKLLNFEKKYYNIYYFCGKDFYNVGGDYKFFWKCFFLLGEMVIDKCGIWVIMNMLCYLLKGGI